VQDGYNITILVSSSDLDDVGDHGCSPQIRRAAMSQLSILNPNEKGKCAQAKKKRQRQGVSNSDSSSRLPTVYFVVYICSNDTVSSTFGQDDAQVTNISAIV
jgi:hypothetical protein